MGRKDFFFLNDKDKEKRVDAVAASELLLKGTSLKDLRICLYTKTTYLYTPEGLYGPFTRNKVKWLITRVIDKLKSHELMKPSYIDQVFKALKNSSQVAVSGAILLLKG